MNNQYTKARTCTYRINYHLAWSVLYREKVLTADIEERLHCILEEIGKKKGFTVVKIKINEEDHIHCFVSAPPKLSPTQIMKYLKGISGNILLKEFPELKKALWKGHLWNKSYLCESYGTLSEDQMEAYMERQRHCQL